MSLNDRTTVKSGTGIDESLQTADIFSTAKTIPEISRFVEAIEQARLRGDVQTADFKTLFAPSNDALSNSSLPKDGAALAEVVGRHIVIGRQTEADLRTTKEVRTLAGGRVPVEYRAEGSLFGGARIIRRDIPCVNGQIHVIDGIAS
jgi:uncharacterized surface protein with fasciclin (FAS1) repeats